MKTNHSLIATIGFDSNGVIGAEINDSFFADDAEDYIERVEALPPLEKQQREFEEDGCLDESIWWM